MRPLTTCGGWARIRGIVAGLSLVVVSCQLIDHREEVIGTWVLESVTVGDAQLDVAGLSTREIPDVPLWIRFDSNGALTGEGSCNDFQGSFEIDGGRIRIREVMSSAVACKPDQNVEEAVLRMLWDDAVEVILEGTDRLHVSTAASSATFIRE